jgi:hypothetical protein
VTDRDEGTNDKSKSPQIHARRFLNLRGLLLSIPRPETIFTISIISFAIVLVSFVVTWKGVDVINIGAVTVFILFLGNVFGYYGMLWFWFKAQKIFMPAGHPWGAIALALSVVQLLVRQNHLDALLALSCITTGSMVLWVAMSIRDVSRSRRALTSSMAAVPLSHEIIHDANKNLAGTQNVYINFSEIKTKSIVELQLDADDIKLQIFRKLQSAGIHVMEQKQSAAHVLELHLSVADSPRAAVKAVALLVIVKEVMTSQRLQNAGISMWCPIWLSKSLILIEGRANTSVIQKQVLFQVEQFVDAWQKANPGSDNSNTVLT